MRASLLYLAVPGLLLAVAGFAVSASAQELTTQMEMARTADVQNAAMQPGGAVAGMIVNHSDRTLRNVKLEIDYAWIWRNDFKPGTDNPGRTVYYTVPGEIAPHGQMSFSYEPSPPLPSRHDGHFVPTARIVGFTMIGQ
jgi:hypothetical protein